MKIPLKRVFGVPALLALVSGAGLVSALIGDGAWDWCAWLGVAAPLAAIGWALRTRRL